MFEFFPDYLYYVKSCVCSHQILFGHVFCRKKSVFLPLFVVDFFRRVGKKVARSRFDLHENYRVFFFVKSDYIYLSDGKSAISIENLVSYFLQILCSSLLAFGSELFSLIVRICPPIFLFYINCFSLSILRQIFK